MKVGEATSPVSWPFLCLKEGKELLGKTNLKNTCDNCGKRFEPARRGGPRIKYCSIGCRRTGDRMAHRANYKTAAEQRQVASEAEAGYWTRDDDAPDTASALFLDLCGGEYRPNHRTAVMEALIKELESSGFEYTDDRLASGLRPQDYDARSRALFDDPEYAEWTPDVDRERVYRESGSPTSGDSPPFGGPYRHRDRGWIPIDEWFDRQEDDSWAWVNGRSVDPANMV
jgi:hypothetical protein